MIAFETYLIEKGYEPFESHFINKKGVLKPKSKNFYYSTMGHLRLHYIHPETNHEIVVGLHQVEFPDTLIYPRPSIRIKMFAEFDSAIFKKGDIIIINENWGDMPMGRVLQEESNEDIFKALFDRSIIFEYDLTKSLIDNN